MKIFFNRLEKRQPWGGGSQFINGMCDYLRASGHDVTFHLEEGIDVLFMIDPRPGDIGYSVNHIINYKQQNPGCKILHRINECDARKNTNFIDNILIESTKYVDKVVFISEWLQNYFKEKGVDIKNSSVIYNGCNLDHFYPRKNESRATGKSKIKLVTHHWSDNWMKGHDLYKFLDEEVVGSKYEFTYVGRYCKEYQPKNTKIIEPLWGESLGNEIRKHDIYVTASRHEPCGMHHIEGAASGLPVIYHEDCGGIVELCKKHGESYRSFDDFLEKLNKVENSLENYRSMIDYKNLDINRTCKDFYEQILLLHSKDKNGRL